MPGPAASAAVNTTCPVPRTRPWSALPVNPEPVGDTLLLSSSWADAICASAQAPFIGFASHEVPVLELHSASA
jgi:hypothetical protein